MNVTDANFKGSNVKYERAMHFEPSRIAKNRLLAVQFIFGKDRIPVCFFCESCVCVHTPTQATAFPYKIYAQTNTRPVQVTVRHTQATLSIINTYNV